MGSRADRAEQRTEAQLARESKRAEKGRISVGILSTLTSPRQWTKPQFSMPMVTAEHELEPIGEFRGRQWFAHKKYGELQERPKLLTDRDALPDTVIVETTVDGERAWRAFDLAAPGTLDGLRRTPARAPKPPAPHRGIDALEMTYLGQSQPERIVAFAARESMISPLSKTGTAPLVKPSEPPARGAVAVIARLHKAGAVLHLSTDRQHVILTASGGRPTAGMVELFEAAQPLIKAYMLGGPLLCVVADHAKGQDPTATTILVGGCPSCDLHASEPILAKGAA
jgi:hypothetical protein